MTNHYVITVFDSLEARTDSLGHCLVINSALLSNFLDNMRSLVIIKEVMTDFQRLSICWLPFPMVQDRHSCHLPETNQLRNVLNRISVRTTYQ